MRKTEWHFWTLDQYNEEEQWLNKKAEEGWALVDAFAVRYVFESCEPGEYVYKILFTDGFRGTEERDNFISFMNENGVKAYGCYVIATPKALLEMLEESKVAHIDLGKAWIGV